ncbi:MULTISPECIES: AMP-binding protein [Mycobacterium]|uniref:AMP-binding protein n=1 Tax=Mycobacterium TaxID=1763 RepID=UPI001EE184F9|nr:MULTISPECIES: AMP-binding protein [Mycobacterium]BDE13797.1 acyl-CoA synthetase [Mycobacterium sp. 20KCMC460]GLB90795.1 acyl-CoA synthetase [Mycobacterium kiyosense]GLC00883.1 acyl-CoA synthetase [Mycobacterium kiyosense]GLC08038.1 acyl-CoA synthetase [Mycobacterium kiyosense]GLC12286.1 acyl-CoA synthetase [Mycobacterium kiyosense]
MVGSSIPAVLRERASLNPNGPALTYIDYDQDWEGVEDTLSWAKLYRRTLNIAEQLKQAGSPGDRALILAPQGLEYIAGFLGALQAGFIAVPLTVPYGGAHDERTISVLADTSPSVLLTTSAVVDNVRQCAEPHVGEKAPAIIEVDLLDLDARPPSSRPARDTGDQGAKTAYLQYTSGSTRTPAGVTVSNDNVIANFGMAMGDFFVNEGAVPSDLTVISWLPLYHDLGLLLGTIMPTLAGRPTVLFSPAGFLQRPARWPQLLARYGNTISAGPNFAFDIAARKTSDEDMAGLDMSRVHTILNGSERVQPATLKRFADRFAQFRFQPKALRPAYGMAETVVYIATRRVGDPPEIVEFDSEKLPDGQAVRVEKGTGTALVSYGRCESQEQVRIVDGDTRMECPEGTVGEIWVHGPNVAAGYWEKPETTARTFGAKIVNPTEGTVEGPWLRTGDSGFFSGGELFIMGRIKDLLIVYGRNHSPDDIEATIQDINPGRCAAIAVPQDGVEKLAAIVEIKKKNGESDDDLAERLGVLKRDISAAIYDSHGLSVTDLVLVSPGSIPITTSGKIRRQQSVQMYQDKAFARLDA